MPKRWEIWWAWFEYEDIPTRKLRPVLVLSENQAYILSAKITSKGPRNIYGEYEIIKWKSANLSKPSTIRLSQIHRLNAGDFAERIGILQPMDRQMVEEKLGLCP